MNFKINRTTTWAAIIAILLKMVIASIPFFITQQLPDWVYFTNGIIENLLIIFILIYLKNFTNKITGIKSLDVPLILWMALVSIGMILDIYKYIVGVNEILHVSAILGGLYLLQTIYFITKIFSTSKVPYKSYLSWVAIAIVIQLFISMPLPFLTGTLADSGHINFEYGMYITQIIINVLHQLPYVVILLLCLRYLKDGDTNSIIKD